jgi:hypothetical protein
MLASAEPVISLRRSERAASNIVDDPEPDLEWLAMCTLRTSAGTLKRHVYEWFMSMNGDTWNALSKR